MRFLIKNTMPKAEKEGDQFIRYSGVSEPFVRISERDGKKIGVDGGGNPKLVFNTGLDEKQVQFFKWYTPEEQKEIERQIVELRPLIVEFYGGEDVVEKTNQYFGRITETLIVYLYRIVIWMFSMIHRDQHMLSYISL